MQTKKSHQEFPIYYIVEAAVNPGDLKTDIVREDSIVGADGRTIKMVTADSVLQTFDELNWNGRRYPSQVVMKGLDRNPKIQNDIARGQWGGEFCHPDSKELSRQSQVLSPSTSHWIMSYRQQGNNLIGRVKTVPYGHGLDMYNILMAGHPWGFSFRGFGSVDSNGIAQDPLTAVTYDQVNRPSHKTAYATKNDIVTEGAVEIYSGLTDEIIQESSLMYMIESNTIQKEITNFVLDKSDNLKIAQEIFGLHESVGEFNDAGQVVLEGSYMNTNVKVVVPVESYIKNSYYKALRDITKF